MASDRTAFEATTARRYIVIPVATIGDVRIQSLTHAERMAAHARLKADDRFDLAVWYIIACVVDDHGNTIFTEHDAPMVANFDAAIASALDVAIANHVFAGQEKKT